MIDLSAPTTPLTAAKAAQVLGMQPTASGEIRYGPVVRVADALEPANSELRESLSNFGYINDRALAGLESVNAQTFVAVSTPAGSNVHSNLGYVSEHSQLFLVPHLYVHGSDFYVLFNGARATEGKCSGS